MFIPAAAIAAIALLVGLMPLPYGYYFALRVLVCAVGAYGAVLAHRRNQLPWVWILGSIAFLFNPIIPINLDRETWAVMDVGAAALLFAAVFSLRQPLSAAGGGAKDHVPRSDLTGNTVPTRSEPDSNVLTIKIPDSDGYLQRDFERAGGHPQELYLSALRERMSDDEDDVDEEEEDYFKSRSIFVESYFDDFTEHEPFHRIILDTCENDGLLVRKSFDGAWLVKNKGSTERNAPGIWSVAVTRRGNIAVYHYKVYLGTKSASFHIYPTLADAASQGLPGDILRDAGAGLNRRFIQELDI